MAFCSAALHPGQRSSSSLGSACSGFAGLALRASNRPRSSPRVEARVVFEAMATSKPPVMVNGAPGKMGIDVSKAVLRRGLTLVPYSLTGEDVQTASCDIGGVDVKLLRPSVREGAIDAIKQDFPSLIAVDYTHPTAVIPNAEFYVKHNVPFVMGTTGGDRDALMKIVNDSKIYCVIAPNMGKQIVAFQAMMEYMANEFPGAFSGYKLKVVESHQSSKADTSGTAKAVVASFKKLGVEKFDVDDIEMVRDPVSQVSQMQVPEEFLLGHAFHTYSLISPDGTVSFEFKHNVSIFIRYGTGVDAKRLLGS
eukprot:tig00000203_g17127.t1